MATRERRWIRQLRSWLPWRRREAASALGLLRDPSGLEPLLHALGDWYAGVRQAAADALGELADPRAIHGLEALMDDHRREVRQAAARALGRLNDPRALPPLIRALHDPSSATVALDGLVVQGEAAVGALLRALQKDVRASRSTIEGALVRLGPAGVPSLTQALDHKEAVVRAAAATALGKLHDGRAVGALICSLGDPHTSVRESAAGALRRQGEGPLAFALVNALRGDLSALRQAPDQRAVAPLLRALCEGNAAERAGAAEGLGILADPQTVDPLIDALGDPQKQVRFMAAQTLGRLGERALADAVAEALRGYPDGVEALSDPRALRPLARALRDPEVRQGAGNALVRLGVDAAPHLLEALRDPEEVVHDAAEAALGGLGDTAAVPLIEALTTPDSRVRRGAAKALAVIGDERAVAPLIRLLTDLEPGVRSAAASALARIGPPAVAPLIRVLLREPGINLWASGRMQSAAAQMLGRLRDARAVEPLIGALASPDRVVREAAAGALGELGHLAGLALAPLRGLARDDGALGVKDACRRAAGQIQDAMRGQPAELEAAPTSQGRGTEPESSLVDGRGTEPEAAG